jgi:hypothetical protein
MKCPSCNISPKMLDHYSPDLEPPLTSYGI